jgi:hypothetical protein
VLKVLGVDHISANDNFFELRGTSLQGRVILSHTCMALGIKKIPLARAGDRFVC